MYNFQEHIVYKLKAIETKLNSNKDTDCAIYKVLDLADSISVNIITLLNSVTKPNERLMKSYSIKCLLNSEETPAKPRKQGLENLKDIHNKYAILSINDPIDGLDIYYGMPNKINYLAVKQVDIKLVKKLIINLKHSIIKWTKSEDNYHSNPFVYNNMSKWRSNTFSKSFNIIMNKSLSKIGAYTMDPDPYEYRNLNSHSKKFLSLLGLDDDVQITTFADLYDSLNMGGHFDVKQEQKAESNMDAGFNEEDSIADSHFVEGTPWPKRETLYDKNNAKLFDYSEDLDECRNERWATNNYALYTPLDFDFQNTLIVTYINNDHGNDKLVINPLSLYLTTKKVFKIDLQKSLLTTIDGRIKLLLSSPIRATDIERATKVNHSTITRLRTGKRSINKIALGTAEVLDQYFKHTVAYKRLTHLSDSKMNNQFNANNNPFISKKNPFK